MADREPWNFVDEHWMPGAPEPARLDDPIIHGNRWREALIEAEATLRHIQPYVGLLVQYLPDSTRRVAAAREKANAALSGASPRTDQTKEVPDAS